MQILNPKSDRIICLNILETKTGIEIKCSIMSMNMIFKLLNLRMIYGIVQSRCRTYDLWNLTTLIRVRYIVQRHR